MKRRHDGGYDGDEMNALGAENVDFLHANIF